MPRNAVRTLGWLMILGGALVAAFFIIACSCRITLWTAGGVDGIFLGEGVLGLWTNISSGRTGLTIDPPALPYLWGCDINGPGPTEKQGVSFWPVAIVLIAIGAGTVRLARALPRGHCPHCRYNLTGLPPNSPCPECGTPAAPIGNPPQDRG